VTLSNTGNAALTVASLSTRGNFSQTNTCGTSVAAGGSCTISVAFAPTSAGALSGALTITDNSNGAAGSTQTVNLSGTGQDFTLGVAAGSQPTASVSPGQTATYTLSVAAEGGFNQNVNFSCTGAPSEATCTVSPSSAVPGSSVTVSVATTAQSSTLRRTPPPVGTTGPQALLALAALMAGIAWFCRTSKLAGARLRRLIPPLAAALTLALALTACGGGEGGGSGTSPSNPGTPAGSYAITVTATQGSGSSAVSHSMALTLTVS